MVALFFVKIVAILARNPLSQLADGGQVLRFKISNISGKKTAILTNFGPRKLES